MAPFEENLTCEPDTGWGTNCTGTCIKAGVTPSGASEPCPSTESIDWDTAVCEEATLGSCCACICSQFCPLLSQKFCRKKNWDEVMFKDSTTNATTCGTGG
jgi:hypothetical protein